MKSFIRSRLLAAFFLSLSSIGILYATPASNDNEIILRDSAATVIISDDLKVLKDSFNNISLNQILAHHYDQDFGENHFQFLSRKDTSNNFWIHFSLVSELKQPNIYKLQLDQYLGIVDLYIIDANGKIAQRRGGFQIQMKDKSVKDATATLFNLVIMPHDSLVLYIHAVPDPLFFTYNQVSASLIPETVYVNQHSTTQLILGIYFGFGILTIIYSLLFYFTVRDRNFLFLAGLVFFIMSGFADAYSVIAERIFPNYPWYYIVRFGSAFLWLPGTVIFYQLFISLLLNLKTLLPKTNIFLWVLVGLCILLGLGTGTLAFFATLCMVMFFGTILIALLYLSFKGNRTAKFLLAASLFFLIGGIIASLGFVNIIRGTAPLYAALFGSALNMLILSIGITDRVRLLRLEKEEAQQAAIKNLEEKDKLILDQNLLLEQKVEERTRQLRKTQDQLVQSEKMASIGQLTAGVAHEINNPINFVSANINPLKRNFKELIDALQREDRKLNSSEISFLTEETQQLLGGIEEGSRRTAEIVRGLRNFSRTDEEVMKQAGIREGIESTLLILSNKLKHQGIEVIKLYGDIPVINCYAGQLDQVWMNLLTNAIDAIGQGGKIFITTDVIASVDGISTVRVSIRDTGKGMSEEVRKKIFDPFFTTKDVGKGTGLGMSISYGIIEKHKGKIDVISEVGKGTEFIVTLPVA